jgi:hypothetical protein
MHTQTLRVALSILPLLEASAEGFFWNLPEFSNNILFYVLHGSEMCPLEAHFQSMEKPKVMLSEIQVVSCLRGDRTVLLSEELLHNELCAARCVIVIQEPLSPPLAVFFPLNCTTKPLQNLPVEMTSNTLNPQRIKLPMPKNSGDFVTAPYKCRSIIKLISRNLLFFFL